MRYLLTISFINLLLSCANHDEKLMLKVLKSNNLTCEASLVKAHNDLLMVRKLFFRECNKEYANKIIEDYEKIINPVIHFKNTLMKIPNDSILTAFNVVTDTLSLYLHNLSYDCTVYNDYTIKYYKQMAKEGMLKYSNEDIKRNFILNCLYHIPDCYVKTISVGKYMPSHGSW